jgi:hypothetical protein
MSLHPGTQVDPPRDHGGRFAEYATSEGPDLDLTDAPTAAPDPVLGTPTLIGTGVVYHVGTLDRSDREDVSYEGDGLSVSVDPDDWASIARLPGHTWSLERHDGEPLRFVSWHDFDDEARDRVRAWAAEKGWVTQRDVQRLTYLDADTEETVTAEFSSFDEACEEVDAQWLDDYQINPVTVWRATDEFPERIAFRDQVDPTDVLLGAYIRENRPDLDGVWWADDHDPANLSAPRGVLVHDIDDYERIDLDHSTWVRDYAPVPPRP